MRHREPELGLRLGAALAWFWSAHGRHAEARAVLAQLLRDDAESRAHPSRPATRPEKLFRARAIHAAGQLAADQKDLAGAVLLLEEALALYQELEEQRGAAALLGLLAVVHQSLGRPAVARAMADESLTLWRQVGDSHGMRNALGSLALLADMEGEYSTARALYSESLAASRQAGDSKSVAWALNCLGQVAQRQGELEAARALHEESLAIWQSLDSPGGIGWSLMNLGHIARAQGDPETAVSLYGQWETIAGEIAPAPVKALVAFSQARLELDRHEAGQARTLLDQSLVIFEQQGERSMIAHCHLNLGRAALLLGDPLTARTEFATALPMFREMNDRWAIALSLEAFADLGAALGDAHQAARLLGAADGLCETVGAPRPPIEQSPYDRQVTALRTLMGETAFAAAHAQGSALPLEQAINEALRGAI